MARLSKCFFVFLNILIQYTSCIDIELLKNIFSDKDCIAGSLLSLEDYQPNNNINNKLLDKTQTLELPSQEKSILSQVQELAQFHSVDIHYELIKKEGPSHNPIFTINLHLGDETYTGLGNSQKDGKRKAAIQAIKNTKFEHPPIKMKESEKTLTPTVLLNNLAAKLGLSVSYSVVNNDLLEELQSTNTVIEPKSKKAYLQRLNDSLHANHSIKFKKDVPNLKGPFKVKVLVNGEKFIGVAHTIKNAKHEAASKALKHLKKESNEDNLHCLKEGSEAACKQAKQKNKSPISLVYETAQTHNLPVDFEIIEEKGPGHKKSFVIKCLVGDFETTGAATSKKEAKKVASENMLEKLQNLPILNNKKSKIPEKFSPKQSKNQKRRTRKKNRIIKTTLDKIDKYVEDFVEFGADLINKFARTQEPKTAPKNDKRNWQSPTEEILKLGNMLNLNIQYSELQESKNRVFTILDLGTNPSYICLGEGITQKNSRDLASRNGITFLYQLGFLDSLMEKTRNTESITFEKEENHKFWLQVVDEETE